MNIQQLENKMNPFVRMVLIGIAGLVLSIYALAGITHINPGEVGILIKNLGSDTGMQNRVLSIGTHWIEPFAYDVVSYDARCRQMQEQPEAQSAGTADGQPVEADFTIQLCLLPKFVPNLHATMGAQYYENVVHPAIVATVKNKIPSEPSDVIYTARGRDNVEKAINAEIVRRFGESGIQVEINLRDVKFTNSQYVQILEQKARAAQQVEVNTRLAQAAVQDAIRVANVAEGIKQQRIKGAEADREEQKLKGEGQRLQKEEDAKGILALAKAEAEGTRLKRDALEGPGGDRLVQIEWARNLGPNVKVYAIPTGSPGTSSIMDLNGILKGAFTGVK